MLPTHLIREGDHLPEENCYLVTGSGNFIKKNTGLIRAIVPVAKVPGLNMTVTASASFQAPKVPAELLARALLFCKAVWKRHRAEGIVLLHYSTKQRKYALWCPNQRVVGLRIESYDPHERFKGFQLVGTIHSHANGPAGHSDIDYNDEKNFDGVHITLGHVADLHHFSLSASLMVNSIRFSKDPAELIEGIKPGFDLDLGKKNYRHIQFPRNWLKKVMCERRGGNAHQNHRFGRNRLLPDRSAAAFSGIFG